MFLGMARSERQPAVDIRTRASAAVGNIYFKCRGTTLHAPVLRQGVRAQLLAMISSSLSASLSTRVRFLVPFFVKTMLSSILQEISKPRYNSLYVVQPT
jgi:hypothetical protein